MNLGGLFAQEAILVSGKELASGGSLIFSLGQVFFTANSGVSGSMAQVIQQPFEASMILDIEEEIIINLCAYSSPQRIVLS